MRGSWAANVISSFLGAADREMNPHSPELLVLVLGVGVRGARAIVSTYQGLRCYHTVMCQTIYGQLDCLL